MKKTQHFTLWISETLTMTQEQTLESPLCGWIQITANNRIDIVTNLDNKDTMKDNNNYHLKQIFLSFHWPRAHHMTCK